MHAFLNGVKSVDLEGWMKSCEQNPSLIKLSEGDLCMYDDRPISMWEISELSYDYDHIKISQKRLKALMWVCSVLGYEELLPSAEGIDLLPLKNVTPLGFTEWNHQGQMRCLELIRAGHVDHVEFRKWLSEKPSLNIRDIKGQTPLLTAICAHQFSMVDALLNAGADLSLADPNGFTPLLMSIEKQCSVDIVKRLLEAGADAEYRRTINSYPLYLAIQVGRVDLADLLIEYGASIDGARQTDPPLFATFNTSTGFDMLWYLLDKGADINEVNYNMQSPLIVALETYGDTKDPLFIDFAKDLIELGSNLNLFDGNQYYPIHHAVLNGALEIVQLILEKGFDINKAPRGLSPLWMATAGQQDEVALYLIQQGANTDIPTDIGDETPLFAALTKSSLEVIKALIDAGNNLNHVSNNGRTPLMLAVQHKKEEIFHSLLDRDVDVNVRDQEGQSAIYFATNEGQADMFEKLLQKGATLEHSAQNGYTLLHTACNSPLGGCMIPRLLELGLDPSARDHHGHTPLHFFLYDEDPLEMTKLLVEAGAPIDAESHQGASIRDFAQRNGHQAVIEWFDQIAKNLP